MKRKRGGSAATDLRSFLQRAVAKKKPPETEVVSPPTNENQMQIVVFQGQSTSGSGRNTIPILMTLIFKRGTNFVFNYTTILMM